MYFATLKHIHLIRSPGFDIQREISLDESGAEHLKQLKEIAFGTLGMP